MACPFIVAASHGTIFQWCRIGLEESASAGAHWRISVSTIAFEALAQAAATVPLQGGSGALVCEAATESAGNEEKPRISPRRVICLAMNNILASEQSFDSQLDVVIVVRPANCCSRGVQKLYHAENAGRPTMTLPVGRQRSAFGPGP